MAKMIDLKHTKFIYFKYKHLSTVHNLQYNMHTTTTISIAITITKIHISSYLLKF